MQWRLGPWILGCAGTCRSGPAPRSEVLSLWSSGSSSSPPRPAWLAYVWSTKIKYLKTTRHSLFLKLISQKKNIIIFIFLNHGIMCVFMWHVELLIALRVDQEYTLDGSNKCFEVGSWTEAALRPCISPWQNNGFFKVKAFRNFNKIRIPW